MTGQQIYLLAADLMLVCHLLVAGFIVSGLVLVLCGGWLGWRWVTNPWFRVVHIVAIGVVVLQSWLGQICPLTVWEMALREKAGAATYQGAFIAHWLEAVLYYQAPPWAFAVIYTLFGVLVVLSWWWVPPVMLSLRRRERANESNSPG